MHAAMPDHREILHTHLFAGLGGGARGFNRASARVGSMTASFRCLGGVDVDAAAREVIEKAGYGDAFIHSIGHQLGMEVHDVTPDGPLRAGMVVTIEPGVYLPGRKLGVRIEDDLLITPSGNQNLTAAIPKTVAEVEAAMARGR